MSPTEIAQVSDEKKKWLSANSINQLVIEPARGWSKLGLLEIWEFRELAYYLTVRELQGVYRQTALGITWIFIRPLLNVLLLTIVFGRVMKVPSGEFPYPLFALAALIPWGFFSNAVTRASRSLTDNVHIVSKVYFPRMILPFSGVISGIADLGASLFIFFIALLLYRMPLRIEMLWLPALVVMTMAFALSFGLWLATLSVRYRDVSFAITFILLALMYLSPVIYPITMIPESFLLLYQLNPMTGLIQGFRWALLGDEAPGISLVFSGIVIIMLLISGMYIFRRTERGIVDVL
jgi:lipopolysaccharide transport system permease protein